LKWLLLNSFTFVRLQGPGFVSKIQGDGVAGVLAAAYLLPGLCCTPQPCSDPEAEGWMVATSLQHQNMLNFREGKHKILISHPSLQ